MVRGGQVGVPVISPADEVLLNADLAEDESYEEEVTSLPELAVPLSVVYGSGDQLLDWFRVVKPTYCVSTLEQRPPWRAFMLICLLPAVICIHPSISFCNLDGWTCKQRQRMYSKA